MSILPFKYVAKRKYPSSQGNNVSSLETTTENKITTMSDFIDLELNTTRQMLKGMSCQPDLIQETLDKLKETMLSAQINYDSSAEEEKNYIDECVACGEQLTDIDINSCEICSTHLCDDCIKPHDVYSGLCEGCHWNDKNETY